MDEVNEELEVQLISSVRNQPTNLKDYRKQMLRLLAANPEETIVSLSKKINKPIEFLENILKLKDI